MTDDDVISGILATEGWPAYTNNPNDRGGPTRGGITLATLSQWRGKPCTAKDVESLSEGECRAIYAKRYITDFGFDKIKNEGLRAMVIDAGVLHGQARAGKWLQELVGLTGPDLDGVIGPKSAVLVNRENANALRIRFAVRRVRFIGELLNENAKARKAGKTSKDQALFAEGWCSRSTQDLLDVAAMLRPAIPPAE